MRIIEHSTTAHGVVNWLSHSGTRFKKTVRIPAFHLHGMLYNNRFFPIRPGFRTRPTTGGRKTSSNRMPVSEL